MNYVKYYYFTITVIPKQTVASTYHIILGPLCQEKRKNISTLNDVKDWAGNITQW